ncbi:MAG: pyrroline-5-carboxylate reductase [Pseudomonadota bacterium]
MGFDTVERRGIVLLGCGKMGSAMLAGWMDAGLPARSVWVNEPAPSDWLKGLDGLHLNRPFPEAPAVVLIAVKPQMMDEALPALAELDGHPLFLSVAAGTPISKYQAHLGAGARIIRAMPKTPAAVARGITALFGSETIEEDDMVMAETLLSAIGQTVRLAHEAQMDAVTAVSGSGPAYVFHLIEMLAAAGEAEGLPPDLAMQLAKATVGGAGHLAEQAEEDPAQLRINVTSPNGTTAAALEVLMDPTSGFPALLPKAVAAAARRSEELGNG